MFVSLFSISVAAISFSCVTGGLGRAGRVGMMIAFLTPTWMMRTVGALTFDLRLAVLMLAIPVLLLRGRWINTLNIVDLLVAVLVSIAIVSMVRTETFSPSEFLALVAAWVVPYLLGRLLVADLSDLDKLIPYACATCLMLCGWSVFESTTRINPMNALVGRLGSRSAENDIRMNLRRAEGPTEHPIYFGMTIAMLFPWAIEAARRAVGGRLPSLYKLMPIVCVVGVFCTVSRGPFLVMLVTTWFAATIALKRWRTPLVAGALTALVFVVTLWPVVIKRLQQISGEKTTGSVVIKGVEHPYSGTKHRTLLYLVYEDALRGAGVLGFGKWGVKPEHLVYVEPQLRDLFVSIDNHYVLLILNWGIAGLVAFIVMGTVGCLRGVAIGMTINSDYRVLLGSLSGTLLAVMLMLLTVWFSSAIGFAWLCQLGILASSSTIQARATRDSSRANVSDQNSQPTRDYSRGEETGPRQVSPAEELASDSVYS